MTIISPGNVVEVIGSSSSTSGPAQQITTLENFDKREQSGTWEMSSPKPVFNGKKCYNRTNSGGSSPANGTQLNTMIQEASSQHHEENVRYFSEVWQRVSFDLEKSKKNGREDGPEIYREKFPNTLQGFEAIDLEQWWGKRTMDKIKASS